MKKLFLKSLQDSLLLGLFLLSPLFTQCADQPIVTVLADQPHHESVSPGIDATYATKNLLSSIMETFPHLTVPEALLQSALLGIMSETEVQLHMYGTFTTKPDPNIAGRTIKVFNTNTSLNKIARSMFDVLDDKLRPTALASNPFVGLDGKILAKMMLILTKDGMQGLVDALEPTPAKKKTRGKNGEEASVKTEELSLLDEWWESYRASRVKGVFTKKSKFLAKILDDPKKKNSLDDMLDLVKDPEVDAPFIELLKEFASKSETDPTQADKQKEELSKLFMTFLCVKDQKQKATGKSSALKEYYTTLLGKEFTEEHYTAKELEDIGNSLLDETQNKIYKNTKNLDETSAYLAHFTAGNLDFLNAPFNTYTSQDKTKSFPYCAEATIRSIVNSLLYNPETGTLNMALLPESAQRSMNQKFKDFIEKHPNPTALNYYGNSLEDWINLVSGIKGVIYKQEGYEVSATAGPKNLVSVLNYLLGTKEDSFEAFGKAISAPTLREIVFSPITDCTFNFTVTPKGQDEPLVAATISANPGHAAFNFKQSSILNLLENEIFRSKISDLSDYSKQSLWSLLFKPSILNTTGDELYVAISNYPELVKTMLFYGANPNFNNDDDDKETPLQCAIFYRNKEVINELLNYGAHVTENVLVGVFEIGDLELVKRFILIREKNDQKLNYTSLLLKISKIKSPSIPIVDFLISKGASLDEKDSFGNTPLFIAIKKGSIDLVKCFVKHGAFNDLSIKETLFREAIDIAASERTGDVSIVECLIDHGGTIPPSEQTTSTYVKLFSNDNVKLISLLIKANIITNKLPFDEKISLLSFAITQGKLALSKFLIQNTLELSPTLLRDMALSTFNDEIKKDLTKSILGKITDISAVLEDKEKQLAINEEEFSKAKKPMVINRHKRTPWDVFGDKVKRLKNLIELIKQVQVERLFVLDLTAQEQECITECITEAV